GCEPLDLDDQERVGLGDEAGQGVVERPEQTRARNGGRAGRDRRVAPRPAPHDAPRGHHDPRRSDPRAPTLLEDDPREQDGEDDLEVEQERGRHRRASLEAPEKQGRREQAAGDDDAGEDPAIVRDQGAAGGRPATPEPAHQAQEEAGAEIEQARQEERRHDVEQPLRERRAEPERERGDGGVAHRHERAAPLQGAAGVPRPPGPPATPVRAPRGTALSCKGWPQEAALRMLMNNLDPDVAERWEDLVVYGGSGKAAR